MCYPMTNFSATSILMVQWKYFKYTSSHRVIDYHSCLFKFQINKLVLWLFDKFLPIQWEDIVIISNIIFFILHKILTIYYYISFYSKDDISSKIMMLMNILTKNMIIVEFWLTLFTNNLTTKYFPLTFFENTINYH